MAAMCSIPAARHVAVLVLPGVEPFDLAVPVQVFGRETAKDRYRVVVCGSRRTLATAGGFSVRLEHGLDELGRADTIVVPGYEYANVPSARELDALRRAAARGARLVSVCTGAFALAEAGLLDGLRATTHWYDAPFFAERFPNVRLDANVLYVADEPVMTSAGLAAGIDLCVQIVRIDHGEAVAAQTARDMVVAPHRDGNQAQYARRQPVREPTRLGPTLDWAIENLDQPLSVAQLAAHAGWAPRTFARRFTNELGTTPHQWLTHQRLLRARDLLEHTTATVESVAQQSGLQTAANLRRLARQHLATTPTAYRRSFQLGSRDR